MSKRSRIRDQADQFRSLAELAWTRNTTYPRDRDRFQTFEPQGQCGVTNFGLGVWLIWRGLIKPQQTLYVEGQVRDSNNELIDDKHAWLLLHRRTLSRVTGLVHADLALDQYPDISQRVTTGYIKAGKGENTHAPYTVDVESPRQMGSSIVTYVPDTVTVFEKYDVAQFKGRLETFLGSCYNSTRFMGQQAIRGMVDELWLPHNSNLSAEQQLGIIATKPCDAQLFSSIMDTDTSEGLS